MAVKTVGTISKNSLIDNWNIDHELRLLFGDFSSLRVIHTSHTPLLTNQGKEGIESYSKFAIEPRASKNGISTFKPGILIALLRKGNKDSRLIIAPQKTRGGFDYIAPPSKDEIFISDTSYPHDWGKYVTSDSSTKVLNLVLDELRSSIIKRISEGSFVLEDFARFAKDLKVVDALARIVAKFRI